MKMRFNPAANAVSTRATQPNRPATAEGIQLREVQKMFEAQKSPSTGGTTGRRRTR